MRRLAPALGLLLAACAVAPPAPTATALLQPTPTASQSDAPVDTPPPVGALDENGIPTALAGVPVHRGEDLSATIAASADATHFLAGGWFHTDAPIRYCALYSGDFAVAECPGVSLFKDRVDGTPRFLAPGDAPGAFTIALAATRPVVVEIHTHDPRCPATDTGCPGRPVMSAIVWLGVAPTDSPPPRPMPTPPPNGLSKEQAVEIARGLADRHTGPIKVRWAVAGPYWAVPNLGGRINDNDWVWSIYLEADFPRSAESEFIAIDYVTGERVEDMTPAGPNMRPDVPGLGP
jgi:hypothetical protein